MVSTIAAYTCRGVIWYQGEGDDLRPEHYARLFALLIRCWRRAWRDELPFVFAQLSSFERDHFQRGDAFPELRRQQELAANTVPNVWMICTIDLGERFNIHPGNKGPVGERLAAAALAQVYGFAVPWRSPQAKGLDRAADGSFRIRFDGCNGGLFIRGGRLRGLRLFARGVELRRFEARIEGDTLVIRPGSTGNVMVDEIRCAAEPYTKANLFNGAGFPVLPFCLIPDPLLRRDKT
jgi:sialate O-acetylesterase